MTDAEFNKLLHHLYVTFPSIREFVLKNSPDPEATERRWKNVLAGCELIDCALVIDNWASGKRKGFEAYQRDQIALMIKQSIEADRDRQHYVNGAHGDRFEFSRLSAIERAKSRKQYKPLDAAATPSLGAAIRRGYAIGEQLRKGEITQEQFDQLRKQILESV